MINMLNKLQFMSCFYYLCIFAETSWKDCIMRDSVCLSVCLSVHPSVRPHVWNYLMNFSLILVLIGIV